MCFSFGWKRAIKVPLQDDLKECRSLEAARRQTRCISWPHACMTGLLIPHWSSIYLVLAYERFVSSRMGRASSSDLSMMMGPSPLILEYSYHSMSAYTFMYSVPECLQPSCHYGCGILLLAREFGFLMYVFVKLLVRFKGGDGFFQRSRRDPGRGSPLLGYYNQSLFFDTQGVLILHPWSCSFERISQ